MTGSAPDRGAPTIRTSPRREIPVIGTGSSLNVAVAGSLVLYKLAGLS